MKRDWIAKTGAVLLIILLLWWLFWAILADEDANALELPDAAQVEQAVE